MSTAMMASLHPSISIYSESVMVTPSPFNPYVASASIMGNFGQLGQPSGGMGIFLRMVLCL